MPHHPEPEGQPVTVGSLRQLLAAHPDLPDDELVLVERFDANPWLLRHHDPPTYHQHLVLVDYGEAFDVGD